LSDGTESLLNDSSIAFFKNFDSHLTGSIRWNNIESNQIASMYSLKYSSYLLLVIYYYYIRMIQYALDLQLIPDHQVTTIVDIPYTVYVSSGSLSFVF